MTTPPTTPKPPATVVQFPGSAKPAPPPAPKPAARRPLCSVPGFLRAVREARELRPDLSRETIIAIARATARPDVDRVGGGGILIAAAAIEERRAALARASGGRP